MCITNPEEVESSIFSIKNYSKADDPGLYERGPEYN